MTQHEQSPPFTLSNPPLICVLARVQFTPIESIADYIPILQEKLRLIDFPHYQEGKIETLHVGSDSNAGMGISIEHHTQWSFSNVEKTLSLHVDQNSLSFIFGDYTDFATAESTYKSVLEAVEACIPKILCVAFQLRYINHIPIQGDPSEWVSSSVLGLPNIGEMQRVASVSETSLATSENSKLVVRCSVLPAGPTLPPDLQPITIKLKHQLQCDSPFITLECVHLKNIEPHQLSQSWCLKQISSLRPNLREAFLHTVTPTALEQWQQST